MIDRLFKRVLTSVLLVASAALCGCSLRAQPPVAVATAGEGARWPSARLHVAPIVADLDGDGVDETVRARRIDASRLVVELVDTCAGGRRVTKLSRQMMGVTFTKIVDADRDGAARELVFELRDGNGERGVQAKVVAFSGGDGGCVAVRRTLFSFPRAATTGRPPKDTGFITGSIQVQDFTKRYSGRELRSVSFYTRPSSACCPSHTRTTFWRYVRSRAGYEPYRTTLTRVRY
jgi:hypothetical protein